MISNLSRLEFKQIASFDKLFYTNSIHICPPISRNQVKI
uniref:Uncharacterized protein n=1 Tax=Rhizophora mucronata TaxID=61149 RepID=A0A2P2LVR9_RHIMU